ncbi:uncharacterized protein LOC130222373 [Danio aesculapii]|uniref:uncharacterized protein LOC130222373 n=1 Tax=Danio aesculapii TaxID=1142201 RepID=UPI0024C0E1FF|nr:uncharacterized protein LOC130222373 [Danio aesculapii]
MRQTQTTTSHALLTGTPRVELQQQTFRGEHLQPRTPDVSHSLRHALRRELTYVTGSERRQHGSSPIASALNRSDTRIREHFDEGGMIDKSPGITSRTWRHDVTHYGKRQVSERRHGVSHVASVSQTREDETLNDKPHVSQRRQHKVSQVASASHTRDDETLYDKLQVSERRQHEVSQVASASHTRDDEAIYDKLHVSERRQHEVSHVASASHTRVLSPVTEDSLSHSRETPQGPLGRAHRSDGDSGTRASKSAYPLSTEKFQRKLFGLIYELKDDIKRLTAIVDPGKSSSSMK